MKNNKKKNTKMKIYDGVLNIHLNSLENDSITENIYSKN